MTAHEPWRHIACKEHVVEFKKAAKRQKPDTRPCRARDGQGFRAAAPIAGRIGLNSFAHADGDDAFAGAVGRQKKNAIGLRNDVASRRVDLRAARGNVRAECRSPLRPRWMDRRRTPAGKFSRACRTTSVSARPGCAAHRAARSRRSRARRN